MRSKVGVNVDREQVRRGVFVLSLYEDGPGPLKLMALWPGGAVSVRRAVEVAAVLAQAGADVGAAALCEFESSSFEKAQQVGAADQDAAGSGKLGGGQGLVFDASA